MEAIWDFIGNILVALGILFTTLSAVFVLISGLVSVYFGRRLFWVFVATLGFMFGLLFSDNVLAYLPPALEPFQELIRLGFAILVAFIALGLQRFGVVVAGGIAVGVLGYYLAGELEVNTLVQWGTAAVSGLLAAALLWFSHDWMLIIITAITGALIGVVGANQINPLPEGSALWIYLILVITGVLYQYRDLGRRTEAVLVAAPSDNKPSARARLPFLRRDAEAAVNAPVTLIESATPATPVAASTVAYATVPAATAPAPTVPAATAPAPAVATPETSAAAIAVAAAALTEPAVAATMTTATVPMAAPAVVQAVAPAPAPIPAPVKTAPPKSAPAQSAPLPAAPASTANVDGQIVVLSSNSGRWIRLPRWQKASQGESKNLPDSQLQPLESGQSQPSPFFKSAPEAYG